jgi:hypothetical protein
MCSGLIRWASRATSPCTGRPASPSAGEGQQRVRQDKLGASCRVQVPAG